MEKLSFHLFWIILCIFSEWQQEIEIKLIKDWFLISLATIDFSSFHQSEDTSGILQKTAHHLLVSKCFVVPGLLIQTELIEVSAGGPAVTAKPHLGYGINTNYQYFRKGYMPHIVTAF